MNKRQLAIANALRNRGEYKLAKEYEVVASPFLFLFIALLAFVGYKIGKSKYLKAKEEKRNKNIQKILNGIKTPKQITFIQKDLEDIKGIRDSYLSEYNSIDKSLRSWLKKINKVSAYLENDEAEDLKDDVTSLLKKLDRISPVIYYDQYVDTLQSFIDDYIQFYENNKWNEDIEYTNLDEKTSRLKTSLTKIDAKITEVTKVYESNLNYLQNEIKALQNRMKNVSRLEKLKNEQDAKDREERKRIEERNELIRDVAKEVKEVFVERNRNRNPYGNWRYNF